MTGACPVMGHTKRGILSYSQQMGSAEIITIGVYILRPWLLLQAPLTIDQVYVNAADIINGSSGGSIIS